MTNDETRMTKQIRMTNDEPPRGDSRVVMREWYRATSKRDA
jgi:hypothetical protein